MAFGSFCTSWAVVGAEEINQGKDDNPHYVDKVPVESSNLYPQGVLLSQGPIQVLAKEGYEPDYATRYVGSVEARQDKEASPEEVSCRGQAVVYVKLTELEDLEAEENGAKESCAKHPDPEGLIVALPNGMESHHHHETAHKQDEGADSGYRNVYDVGGIGTYDALVTVDQVGRDEGAKEQALRAEKGPHCELAVIKPCVSGMLFGVMGCSYLGQKGSP